MNRILDKTVTVTHTATMVDTHADTRAETYAETYAAVLLPTSIAVDAATLGTTDPAIDFASRRRKP